MVENNINKPAEISLTSVLYGIIVISVFLNALLFMQTQSLGGQITALTATIDKLSSGVSAKSSDQSVTQTTLASIANPSSDPSIIVKILNDKRCTDCDTTQLQAKLQQVFPNANFEFLDYSTPAGAALYKSSGVKYLPAVLFDDKVKLTANFMQVSQYITAAGSYYTLAIGALFDPTAKICTVADCADPQCKDSLACRPKISNKLDLFIMSKCPFASQAEDSLKQVLSTIKDIKFNLHYLASYDPTAGFSSLHGPTEVSEDLRQICIAKYYPGALMDYIWCRNPGISTEEWQKCALASKMDTAKIDTCATGDEGKALLQADIKIGEALKISASPTWLANNYQQFSALSAADISSQYCGFNAGAVGCDVKLNSTAIASSSAGCATLAT